MNSKKPKPSRLTHEELERRWSEFVALQDAGIEASELRDRALFRHHEIILKERQARVAAGDATFQDWESAKVEIRRRISTP